MDHSLPSGREWRAIPSAPGYFASALGEIASCDRVVEYTGCKGGRGSALRRGRILRAKKTRSGYLRVNLSVAGVLRYVGVHRLICEAFHGAPFEGAHAAHINGISHDNRPINLRWSTPVENAADKLTHGTHGVGARNPNARINFSNVMEIRREQGLSQRALAEKYGISPSQVRNIQKARSWGGVAIPEQQLRDNTWKLRSKLKPDDIRNIRSSSETAPILARRYGCTPTNITAIKRRKTWRHVRD